MSVGELRGAETYDSAHNRSAVTRKHDEDRSFDEALAVASSRPPDRPESAVPDGGKSEQASTAKQGSDGTTSPGKTAVDSKGEAPQRSNGERAEAVRFASNDPLETDPNAASRSASSAPAEASRTEPFDRSEPIAALARAAISAAIQRQAAQPSQPSPTPSTAATGPLTNPSVDVRGGAPTGQGGETDQAGSTPAAAESMKHAERAAHEPQPISQVTVRFAEADGAEGRLRVAVRGEAIRATIVSGDPLTVQRMTENRAELRQSLRERGFTETDLSIREIDRHARRGGGRSRHVEPEGIDD